MMWESPQKACTWLAASVRAMANWAFIAAGEALVKPDQDRKYLR